MLLRHIYSCGIYVGHKIVARARAQSGQSQEALTAEPLPNTAESHQEQGLRLFDAKFCAVGWHIHRLWLCSQCDF